MINMEHTCTIWSVLPTFWHHSWDPSIVTRHMQDYSSHFKLGDQYWKHDSSTVLLVAHMKSSMMVKELHYTDLPWLSHVKAAQKYVELPVTVTDNLPGTFLPTSEWLTLPLVFVYHPLIPPIFSYPPLWGINQPHKHLNTFSDHSSLRISPQIIEPWLLAMISHELSKHPPFSGSWTFLELSSSSKVSLTAAAALDVPFTLLLSGIVQLLTYGIRTAVLLPWICRQLKISD